MHPCAIISYISFILGLAVNAVVFLSLPFIPGAGIYIVSIDFGPPLTPLIGSLNNIFTFQNLSSLRLGNWAVCLFDNETFVATHGVLCTKFAVGYSITLNTTTGLTNATATTTGNSDTIVPTLWTAPLVIHIASFVFFLVAVIPTGKILWTYIALGVNVASTAYDFGVYGLVTNQVTSVMGIKTSIGPSPTAALASTVFLIIGVYTRSSAAGKSDDDE